MEQNVTREIEIDAGHRIPNHHSACKNVHGHRYKVQATVSGNICNESGSSSEGMVIDFSFLKEIMVGSIHNLCDHTFIIYAEDKIIPLLKLDINEKNSALEGLDSNIFSGIITTNEVFGRLLIVNFIPTAENLAKFWFELIAKQVKVRTKHKLRLSNLRVYETPNCWADYNENS